MNLAIIGSRSFTDKGLLLSILGRHFSLCGVTEVVSGGAAGADSLGAAWGRDMGIKVTEFKPDWETFGKAAGMIRNEDIIKEADFVLAFHDGISKGTAGALVIARRLRKSTLIVYF